MSRTQQRSTQTTGQTTFVQTDAGVSFLRGIMSVDGTPQIPVASQQWHSSNGITVYTTVKWRNSLNGELRTSCNCPAWTMKKKGARRTCCHTKDMEGTEICSREKVTPAPVALTTPAQVIRNVPTITVGERELRSIMLD